MATSYKIIARKDKANGKGENPLYIRITENRKSSYKALGIYVSQQLWDEERQIVKPKFPNSARVNNFLTVELGKVQGKAIEMMSADEDISARKIMTALDKKTSLSFKKYFSDYLEQLDREGKTGTYDKAWATFSKFNKYIRERDFTFNDIDAGFLRSYERYLRDELGNGVNTIHSNLKIFRMLFNKAFREEVITASQNPFIRFKLRTERTQKEFIDEEELNRLEKLEIPKQFMLNHHRWMYIFACHAGGLRISDILQLRWRNFNGTHLTVKMHKTKELVSIKLPDRALQILKMYQAINQEKSENFIFPVLDNNVDYEDPRNLFRALSSATAYANKNLKILADKAGIEKSISFHTSRHTFATRALRKGAPIQNVSKLLGHTNLKTTQIYAKIVNEELDKTMDLFND
ncbi:site-specific integrase [Larkinella ripae]